MKRSIITALSLAAVLAGAQAWAMDETDGTAKDGMGMHDGMAMHAGMGAERMDRMAEKLGLSDDQKKQMEAVMKSHRDANKAHFDNIKKLAEKLKGQVDAKAADSDLKATLDDLKAERKALDDDRIQAQTEREAILTVQQQAKGALMMIHQMQGMRGEWKGHKGKMGDKDGKAAKDKDGDDDKDQGGDKD